LLRYGDAMTGTGVDQAVPGKALRVDAERHRQAVLCAASSVFLAEGPDASLESVAREAGVGIATLYRRFPTRDALVEAVFEAKMAAYADRIEAAAEQALLDPWPAFREYVRDICDMQIGDPAFGRVLLRPMQGSALFADAHARALRASRRLVSRARRAGALRPEVRETDLYLLTAAVAALVAEPGPIPAERAGCRMAGLFLDAVQGPAA
jgi:AcrR family transcriptional regulator